MKPRALRRSVQRKGAQSGGIISSLISLLFVVVLCLALYLARHPLMRFAGEEWVVEDPLERADAIIVLSDDNFYADRATHAADLYRHGMAPYVVASGRRLRPYAGIAELMEHDLVERARAQGQNSARRRTTPKTRGKKPRRCASRPCERKWRSVIVVTSNYHTRRARYIFTHVFPPTVAGAGERRQRRRLRSRYAGGRSEYQSRELTTEVAGMVVAVWELRGEKGSTAQNTSGCRTERTKATTNGVASHVTPQIWHRPFRFTLCKCLYYLRSF